MPRQIQKQIGLIHLTLSDSPSSAEREWLHEQIRAFNDSVSPAHRAIRPSGTQPLGILARDSQGAILGGLMGELYWDWLNIDDLWLAQPIRGQGIGQEILRMAEDEARASGCKRAKLETFSFQARGFYEKQGYRVIGEMTDYPPGQSNYWMRKEL